MDDGYFVLTVMSPDNQGIGGSTSSDGYSMSQTIVVGVEPNAGQTADEADVRLSLIAVTTPSKTRFTRKDKSVPFTPVFRFDLATPCQYTHAYDHKFSLYNERGELVADRLCGTNNLTLRPGNRSLNNFAQVQLDNNIANGTYYIRGRSRLHTADGTGEWLDDEGSGDTYLKMVIEGDTVLTLTAIPSPYDLCGDTIILEGDGCKGTEQRVHARVTNRGGREFYGNMFLLEGSQHGIGALLMGAMRVGEVACGINLMRTNFTQQLADNLHIALGHGQFLYFTAFIERQLEEMNMTAGNAIVGTSQPSLALAYQTLHGQHLG